MMANPASSAGSCSSAAVKLLAALVVLSGAAYAQGAGEIIAVDPDSALQGTSALLVASTLDSDFPLAPPEGISTSSATPDSLEGGSITHAGQYLVTAVFDIPASESTGLRTWRGFAAERSEERRLVRVHVDGCGYCAHQDGHRAMMSSANGPGCPDLRAAPGFAAAIRPVPQQAIRLTA
ncbi:MAG: hypothetical protein JXB46_00815 [Candidatus Eisenbacteria bacterium]|nr:hypothetical protein [Candidatus Eisenbacteria bacterium]